MKKNMTMMDNNKMVSNLKSRFIALPLLVVIAIAKLASISGTFL